MGATITAPFFYGILKRWNDVPKMPVFIATAVICYQVTMGIVGPINSASVLKLYDLEVVKQHATVDIGFGFAYAASIYYGLFKKGKPQPSFAWTELLGTAAAPAAAADSSSGREM